MARKSAKVLTVLALVGGLWAASWLLMSQADVAPAAVEQEQRATQNAGEPPFTLQASGPVTVYLPLVARNFPPPPPQFGVQMAAINDSHGLTRAVEAGVHWVRFSAFHWDTIESMNTDPSGYDWSVLDESSLRNAAANGMEVIALVQFTPRWAQKVPGCYCGPIKQDSLDEFAQFLTALVDRYSAPPYNVRYWELGNEPDVDPSLVPPHSNFGCWGDQDDEYYGGRYYAEMLKLAYPAIKAADPTAQVLIGGLLLDCDPTDPPEGKHCRPARFLEGILKAGGGPYFDLASFHAYTYYGESLGRMGNPNWPESMTAIPKKAAFLREVLEEYGYASKPLMNTEAALLCHQATDHCSQTQAIYVPRAYAEALALGLHGQVYYAMINEPWYHTGLLLPGLTAKPAYHAFQAASSFLTSVEYEGEVTGYTSGVAGYAFRPGDNAGYLDVIWSADGSHQTVDLPPGASAYDWYGTLIASSGAIQVDYSPIYLKRP